MQTNLMYDIPFGTCEKFNTVVEIPKSSHHKYEYDEKLGVFKLNRILLPSMSYPGNYGFIPQTIADDGDPIDILIVKSGTIERGTVVECSPIGALHMIDEGKTDIKVICIPTFHHMASRITTIMDLDRYFIDQIHHFFQHYKDLEQKSVEIKGWLSVEEAIDMVEEAEIKYITEAPDERRFNAWSSTKTTLLGLN